MYQVVYLPFPDDVFGVVRLCDNGNYIIGINQALSDERKAQVLRHELSHIKKGHHFDSKRSIREIEADT